MFDRVVDEMFDGMFDGMFEGMLDGMFDGMVDGMVDGLFDGMFDGMFEPSRTERDELRSAHHLALWAAEEGAETTEGSPSHHVLRRLYRHACRHGYLHLLGHVLHTVGKGLVDAVQTSTSTSAHVRSAIRRRCRCTALPGRSRAGCGAPVKKENSSRLAPMTTGALELYFFAPNSAAGVSVSETPSTVGPMNAIARTYMGHNYTGHKYVGHRSHLYGPYLYVLYRP